MSNNRKPSESGLFAKFMKKRGPVRKMSPAELGHWLLLGVGEMRQDYFYDGEYNLVNLYAVTDSGGLQRLFCECFIFRLFAAYVACVTYPNLRSEERWKPVVREMFRSFYEYAEKEPTRVFFKSMKVNTTEELRTRVVEKRWDLYRKEYNRKGNRGFHVATLFGVFFRSEPDLKDSGSEHAKDFNTKRGVVMAIRFNQMVQSVEKTLDRVFVSESGLERLRKLFFPEKLFRAQRFRGARSKSTQPVKK